MEDTTDQNDAPDGSPQEVLEDITEEDQVITEEEVLEIPSSGPSIVS
ncbi:hypothetical protein SPONN_2364 [uncultured Candidatus Thioglobus sp.]|nr:hypothetical protein SPONL_1864 [uncultured Candidatus Thioglobus sp.]SMN01299.1 hypothetical protein SPONN_2364 [uncultured Candidatus Thioglobus sp.]